MLNPTRLLHALYRFAELTLNRNLDPSVFVRLCRKYKMMSFDLGPPANKKKDVTAVEVFGVLNSEWKKVEDVVHELLIVLQNSQVGERIEQSVG